MKTSISLRWIFTELVKIVYVSIKIISKCHKIKYGFVIFKYFRDINNFFGKKENVGTCMWVFFYLAIDNRC